MTWIAIGSYSIFSIFSNVKLIFKNSQFIFCIDLYLIKIKEVKHLPLGKQSSRNWKYSSRTQAPLYSYIGIASS